MVICGAAIGKGHLYRTGADGVTMLLEMLERGGGPGLGVPQEPAWVRPGNG